jgi:antitoxin component of MazEF toxin-antitoxin module
MPVTSNHFGLGWKDMTERVTAGGLTLSPQLLEQLGWQEGQEVEIQLQGDRLTIVPTPAMEPAILRRSLGYLLERVGDAATVGPPRRLPDCWEVPVFLSYADRQLGVLIFSLAGELLLEASTSPQVMTEAARMAAADLPIGSPGGRTS